MAKHEAEGTNISAQVQSTGAFPSVDNMGPARRSAIDGIASSTIKKLASPDPIVFENYLKLANACPQGNPEDPEYKQGRSIPGA